MRRELKGIYVIWLRDVKRYFRDRARLFGSIAQPLLFLFVLGTGISSSLRPLGGGSGNFIEFMYPGIIGMTILFTSTFSALSIVWDREFGFLKEVMVAPVSRTAIALGKAFGGSTQAMIQGMIMLVIAPLVGIKFTFLSILSLLAMMIVSSFSLTNLGIVIASRMKSMQGFQVISNFLLMPMFFLSGAFFPLKSLPKWMDVLVRIDPLSYSVDGMRYALLRNRALQAFPLHVDFLVMLGCAVVFITSAIVAFNASD